MTCYRDLYDDGCYSSLDLEDLYGFGGLNGYQFRSPHYYYRDLYRYGSPYGFRSYENLYGNRGLIGYRGHYGYADLYRYGYDYLLSRLGHRYGY